MALSDSSSDWGSPAEQRRCNTKWEGWGENSGGYQVNNPMNDSRANDSTPDLNEQPSEDKYNDRWERWELEDLDDHPEEVRNHNPFINAKPSTPSGNSSEHSSEHKYNDRWDKWEPEMTDRDPSRPERDDRQNSFRHSRPSTPPQDSNNFSSEHKYNDLWKMWEMEDHLSHPNSRPSNISSDSSPLSLDQKNNHHWRHRAMECSDGDSHFSNRSVDEDYVPPRPTPGCSDNRSVLRENFTQDKNTPSIGMSLYNYFFHTSRLLLYNPAPNLLNPKNWMSAYSKVGTLKPGHIVSVAVLDFFLSLESHQSQLSTDLKKRFYYLSQDTIGNLTGELEDKKGLLQQSLKIIDENTLRCPFLFLVTPQLATTTYQYCCP
jgi:hypothetical protein